MIRHIVEFPSKRKKKKFLYLNKRYRKVEQKRKKSSSHKKYNSKIRNLYAPSLVGKYELAVFMKITENEDIDIFSMLRDLIPGKFKAVYDNTYRYNIICWKAGSPPKKSKKRISRIYLKKSDDLFALQLAFQEKIWRVMRIVGHKNDLSKQNILLSSENKPVNPEYFSRAIRLFGMQKSGF